VTWLADHWLDLLGWGGSALLVFSLLQSRVLRFRDFSPGEFVWRRSHLLSDRGFSRVLSPPRMVDPYYARLGFRPVEDGVFELEL
jgi:hypothetical protein